MWGREPSGGDQALLRRPRSLQTPTDGAHSVPIETLGEAAPLAGGRPLPEAKGQLGATLRGVNPEAELPRASLSWEARPPSGSPLPGRSLDPSILWHRGQTPAPLQAQLLCDS